MKSDFFIDRPVFSTVLSVIIVIVGVIGLALLPIDQYPKIVPPVVKVSASYPGASAQTVTQAVATPIEQELNGTPGMLYMESSSTNSGGFTATITFDIDTDADLAAVEVQNRVKLAESRLPAEVVQNGISVEKQASSKLLTITLLSSDPKFDEIYLSNYATLNVLDMLRRVPGVGSVSNVGSRYYAMQIWVLPDRLANLGLTVQDLQRALKDQNRESAAGVLGQQPMTDLDVTIPITAQGRLSSVGEFEEIVVRANPDGSIIRLRDVARVSLEASSYNTESGINGGNAAVLNINMLPGANAMEVARSVRETMEEISRSFPEGISYKIPFDMTSYISQSIREVYHTLFEALLLVILVVFLSLQNWRATLIPTIAVPISLIGTFGVMLAFGFSLNMMTLLGLILAIGIVVDDAIVVVEAVERIMNEEGLSPYEATKKAMSGLGSAIIATSLVLCAVFVPVSFLSGITGQLYRQFTITIAVSVLISTFVALTLSPALCALILRPDSGKRKNRLFRRINIWLGSGTKFYERMIRGGVRHSKRMLALFGLTLVALWALNKIVPQSFMPQEDQGYFTVELELPEGATLERTRRVTDRAMKYLMSLEDVEYVLNVTGSSPRVGTNQSRSQLTVILKPWEERKSSNIRRLMNDIREEMRRYPESKVYLSTPPVIPGLGASGGFEMVLEARGNASYGDLQRAVDTLLHYASKRKELTGLSSSMQSDIPQLYFDVDRDKAQMLGVPMADIFSTMKTFTGSVYVNDFNMFNRIYRVYIQAEAPYRAQRENLGLFFVRGADKAMIPITALGTTSYTTGPGTIRRFNMFNAATISGEAAQIQFGAGHGHTRTDRTPPPAVDDRRRVERTFLSGKARQRPDGLRAGAGLPLRLPVPRGAVRELADPRGGDPLAADRRHRRLPGQLGLRTGEQHLFPDRTGDAGGSGGQERHPDRRVRQGRGRKGPRHPHGRHPGRAPALPAHRHDLAGLYPRHAAAGLRQRTRVGQPPGHRHGRFLRHARGDHRGHRLRTALLRLGLQTERKMDNTMKRSATYLLGVLLLLAAGSCSVQKKCKAPQLDMPAEIVAGQSDTLTLSDRKWWEVYTDTTLCRLIGRTLDRNRNMLSAEARIRQLEELYRVSKAARLPSLGGLAAADYETNDYYGEAHKGDAEFDVKATLSWEADLWGNLRWAKRKGAAEYLASVEAARAMQMTLVAEVATAYFELVALDHELGVVRRTVETREESVRQAKLRFEGGLTSETAYQQAKVELASASALIPDLELRIAQKENQISVLAGDYPSRVARSKMDMNVRMPDSLPVGLPSTLLQRRPDVRQAEQNLKAAMASAGMAYADRFPRLTISLTGGLENDALKGLINSPFSYAAGNLTAPLFAFGSKRAKYRAALAAYDQARLAYEQKVLEVFREVNDAVTAYRNMRRTAELKFNLKEAARQYVVLAKLQYINGVIRYIDVLDAQRKFFDAQVEESKAVRNEHLALVGLYKALGGGWQPSDAEKKG